MTNAIIKSIIRASPAGTRRIHASVAPRLPYKNSQDRETLRPVKSENTSSGRDDEVAREHPDAAFDPKSTSPEDALRKTKNKEGGSGGDPLEASGANQEFNKPLGDEKTAKTSGAGREVNKGGASKARSSPKKGQLPRDK